MSYRSSLDPYAYGFLETDMSGIGQYACMRAPVRS